ncbi:MAG: hypothetical protein CVT95_06985 [Bacteroidetes bacterium HGW-Bacteroidetes-12]|nr:MAG: hypothetical protein CVT95_06985 [Bacteroidetes bacterium HGW-Bacteroidetes-12]
MKKFLKNIFKFLLPPFIYSIIAMIVMPDLLSIVNGPSTKQQINYSFKNAISKDYELLISGNSRTYRGLNPNIFSLNTFNFSHDNDSYNQIYYKLNYLLERNKKFNYLILGVDYFQFSFKSDTRNYVYGDLLGNEYMNDFDNSNILLEKVKYLLDNVNPKKLLSLKLKKNKPFLRENGQYIKHGVASENDSIKRDINLLDFQVSYFKKIINLCKSKNIKVFIVMLPTRQNELDSYTEIELNEFNSFIKENIDNKNEYYLNYSKIKNFTVNDYTDLTHFNESSANRFSRMLDKDLSKLVNKTNEIKKPKSYVH